MYADAAKPTWSEPEDISSPNSAIGKTLEQYYRMRTDPVSFRKIQLLKFEVERITANGNERIA